MRFRGVAMLEKIRKRLLFEGADAVGGAYLKGFVPDSMQNLEYGISVQMRLSQAVVEQIFREKSPSHTYFHNYRTLNAMLDRCTFLAVSMLQKEGYRAVAVPASQTVDRQMFAGLISHKLVAVKAGMGRIGRHALFISDELGPAVRLASVLTDCPICAPEPLFVRQEGCGTCSACAKACPAGAISGKEYIPGMPREDFFDAECCSNYMKKSFQMIGRGAVCGICMATCQNRWKEKFLKKP